MVILIITKKGSQRHSVGRDRDFVGSPSQRRAVPIPSSSPVADKSACSEPNSIVHVNAMGFERLPTVVSNGHCGVHQALLALLRAGHHAGNCISESNTNVHLSPDLGHHLCHGSASLSVLGCVGPERRFCFSFTLWRGHYAAFFFLNDLCKWVTLPMNFISEE